MGWTAWLPVSAWSRRAVGLALAATSGACVLPDARLVDPQPVVSPFCGDGVVAWNEECDPIYTPSLWVPCSTRSPSATGDMRCDSNTCRYDTTTCSGTPVCGDGILDPKVEFCDPLLPPPVNCSVFISGITATPTCHAGCGLSWRSCYAEAPPGTCGNDTMEGAEQCDGPDFGGATCLPEFGGHLNCTYDCKLEATCQPVFPAGAGVSGG
jgi:hypothetical protein